MLEDDTEVSSSDEGIVIDGYVFAADELRCNVCESNAVRIDYKREHEEAGVKALALGTECKDCGATALHVSY